MTSQQSTHALLNTRKACKRLRVDNPIHAIALAVLFFACTSHAAPSNDTQQQQYTTRSRRRCTPDVRSMLKDAPPRARIYIQTLPPALETAAFDALKQEGNAAWHRIWGRPIGVDDNRAFRTNDAYAADLWLYYQLLQSSMRVHCVYEADFVFIPGLFLHLRNNITSAAQAAAQLSSLLEQQATALPHLDSLPHVVGTSQPMALHWEVLMQLPQAHRLWWMTTSPPLDGHPMLQAHGGAGGGGAGGGGAGGGANLLQRLITVPSSSFVHLSRASLDYMMPMDVERVQADKKQLAVVTFTAENAHDVALWDECRGAAAGVCSAQPGVHTQSIESVYNAWDAYNTSWYCVLPLREDEPIDRSFADCMLGGAIPVATSASLLRLLPMGDLVDWARLVPVIPWTPEQGPFLKALQQYHDTQGLGASLHLLRELFNVRPLLQYSLNPVHDLVRFDRRTQLVHEDDGFTASLKLVLRTLCREGVLEEGRCAVKAEYARRPRTNITIAL